MKVCNKCLTLHGAQQLYCPTCKALCTGSDQFMRHRATTHKTGRLRTRPSKVYASLMKLG